jgi:hypothetical protein
MRIGHRFAFEHALSNAPDARRVRVAQPLQLGNVQRPCVVDVDVAAHDVSILNEVVLLVGIRRCVFVQDALRGAERVAAGRGWVQVAGSAPRVLECLQFAAICIPVNLLPSDYAVDDIPE